MKLFISWSGSRSKNLAEILRQWLPKVINAIQPYYSPEDLEKGARWSSEITAELESAKIGIICLTRESINSQWILFEVGALSKNRAKARICPILFDLTPGDIKGPLTLFQCAQFEKSEIKKVMIMINKAIGAEGLNPILFDSVFEKWWPDLEKQVDSELNSEHKFPRPLLRSDRELLEEVLGIVRYESNKTESLVSVDNYMLRKVNLSYLAQGVDVESFAQSIRLGGGKSDLNAQPWGPNLEDYDLGPLDGFWLSRWRGGGVGGEWQVGHAMLMSVREHVLIFHREEAFTYYLIVAREEFGARLVGRYYNLLSPYDSTPWVGLVVDNNRIDGAWLHGRWDLRRDAHIGCSEKKRKRRLPAKTSKQPS